jgi:hypothetical protein
VAEAIINEDPELVIHVGDMANVDYDKHPYASWIDFFNATTDELEQVVFMPTAGNHDDSPNSNSEYWKIFHTPVRPSNGSYYSYDAANIHFVVLNSEIDLESQTNWLMRDLQQAANDEDIDWIISYFHRPPYSLGERAGDDHVKTNFCPAFVLYETDIVFSGHSHNYQRWVPIRGVNYYVVGGGGGRLYTSSYTPGSHEYATTCYHYVSCDVTGNVMHLQARRSDGLLFDQVIYTNIGRAVQVTPAFPCRNEAVTISYDPSRGALSGTSPVYLHLGIDDFSSALVSSQMTYNAVSGRWEYEYTVPSAATTRLAFVFRDATSSTWDNNYNYNWQVLLDRVSITPTSPVAGSNLAVSYHADMGPLAGSSSIYMHLAYNNSSRTVQDVVMTNTSGARREYTCTLPQWAANMDIFFSDGATVDDNYGMLWSYTLTGTTGHPPVVPCSMLMEGAPSVSTNPPVIQNFAGDNFDFELSGGALKSSSIPNGFGAFGELYFNYDASNLYVGGIQTDTGGTNNVLVLFLGLDTLSDNATNLWHKNSTPQTLDFMHNVSFSEPMDLAIVLGDEYGDAADYYNFTYPAPTWYDFGQGIYYIGTNSSSFVAVSGARLSQFDGSDSVAVTNTDQDLNRQTDRWEASLPWSSLNATGGIDTLNSFYVAGVIASASTNGNDRYLSATYVGQRTYGARHTHGNFGYDVLSLAPCKVLLEHGDCDNDSMPNLWEHQHFGTAAGPDAATDSDNDFMNNGEEYIANTQPTNAASVFTLSSGESSSFASGQIILSWEAQPDCRYDLHRSTNHLYEFTPIVTNLTTGIYTESISDISHAGYRIRVQRD